MPPDVTLFDILAGLWFLLAWLSYGFLVDRLPWSRPALNQIMTALRKAWMRRMIDRENRVMDSMLIGHAMNSVTFFASTTMLVLAGLVGVFGALDSAHAVLGGLSFAAPTSKAFLELKLLLLVALFVFAFFQFTWSLRQYNYCCALIGSAPPAPTGAVDEDIAILVSLAAASFNGGLRAYYFALAVLAWLIQPWLFFVVTNWMLLVLLRRQFLSRTVEAVRRHQRILEGG